MRTKFLFSVLMCIVAFLILSCSPKTDFDNAPSGNPKTILGENKYEKYLKKFGNIGTFENGIAIVFRNDNSQQLIDYKGNLLTSLNYDSIGNVVREYSRIVKIGDKYGVILKYGKTIIECIYDDIELSCDTASIEFIIKKDDKVGVCDSVGNIIVPLEYDKIYGSERSGYYKIKKDGKSGLCTNNNKILIPIEYDVVIVFQDYGIVRKNNKYAVFNKDFTFVTECIYDDVDWVYKHNKYLKLCRGHSPLKDSNYDAARYGYIDINTGEVVIPFKYRKLGEYKECTPILAKNTHDKYGFIDINNDVIIPFEYDDAEEFSDGLAYVAKQKGYANCRYGAMPLYKSGFINKSGEIVIPIKFYDQSLGEPFFKEGLCPMGIGVNNIFATKFGYIDKTGKYVIEPKFESAEPFEGGVAIVKIKSKVGVINMDGDFVIPAMYDDAWQNGIKDSVITLVKDDEEFLFNLNGAPI